MRYFASPLTKDDRLIDPDSPGITIADLILPSVAPFLPLETADEACVRINDYPSTKQPSSSRPSPLYLRDCPRSVIHLLVPL